MESMSKSIYPSSGWFSCSRSPNHSPDAAGPEQALLLRKFFRVLQSCTMTRCNPGYEVVVIMRIDASSNSNKTGQPQPHATAAKQLISSCLDVSILEA